MKLTEKQKNCPYCHGGDDHQVIYDSSKRSRNLVVNLKNENNKHHPHMLEISYKSHVGAVDYDWDGVYYELPIKFWASVSYCPMCGRPLNEEVKDE